MLINEIKFRLKKKKRIGRGGKKGNYSGRGMKGQKARAGRKIRPAFRDLILKFPQQKGKNFKPLSEKPYIINLETINKKFEGGTYIDVEKLRKILKIPKSKKNPKIKILSNGELTKQFSFSSKLLFSNKAKEKIINSGSTIE